MSSFDSNFILRKQEKYHGARSGVYGEGFTCAVLYFAKNILLKKYNTPNVKVLRVGTDITLLYKLFSCVHN